MSFIGLLLGLTLLGPASAVPADTGKASKPKPETPATAKPAARPALPEPKLQPKPKVKPLPLGEPKLKRRKNP